MSQANPQEIQRGRRIQRKDSGAYPVFKFKRYEDSSLAYMGINKHEGEEIGLYDTVLSQKDVAGDA